MTYAQRLGLINIMIGLSMLQTTDELWFKVLGTICLVTGWLINIIPSKQDRT